MKTFRALLFICASVLLFANTARAIPYASGVTNNNGTIQFIINEPADSLWVIYNDGVSNAITHPPIQVFAVSNLLVGTNYQVNDILAINGGSGTPATIKITGTNSTGQITAFNLLDPGSYSGGDLALPANPVSVTGGAGSNATFFLFYGVSNGLATFTPGVGESNYLIYVKKEGNGQPQQISADYGAFASWATPRGIAVNRNPKVGYLFGRIYVGNASAAQQGVFALNADQTDSPLHRARVGYPTNFWISGSTSSPYRMSVAPDNSLYVGDFSGSNPFLWQLGPDFNATNKAIAGTGRLSGRPVVTGSLATGNLVIFTADATKLTDATNSYGWSADDEGAGHAGEANNVFRYTIGAGPIPAGGWTNEPDLAINVGLNGIPTLTLEPAVEPKTGNIYCMFYRANWADPCLIVTDPTGVNRLFTSMDDSLKNVGPDPFTAAYSIDISPDGRYLLVEDVNNNIFITTITNGIPDLSSTFTIAQPNFGPNLNTGGSSYIANSRGTGFDAADNVYCVSSGQGLLRVFSPGFPSTTVTGNDLTGTNGSFQLLLPPVTATVTATTSLASQGHGTPTAGVFTITLNTNFLSSPLTVSFVIGGTATNGTFIASSTNSITFPAGTSPSGNWSETVTITPTAIPVSGPTFTVTLHLLGAPTYRPVSPSIDTVYIQNTGPQSLSITSVPGPTMYRGLFNDWANFIITRYGDTNQPAYTVTNFTFGGTAVFGVDFLASGQSPVSSHNGSLTPGSPGFVIHPGDISLMAAIGSPVPSPLNAIPVDKTIVVGLGSGAQSSSEGTSYSVSTNTAAITEIDNARGNEIVLWSNPLTAAADSVNWTLTFASTNLGTNQKPPFVVQNYNNAMGYPFASDPSGTNDFDVEFGFDVANASVTPSLSMQSNGWTTALRMSVNKDFNFAAAAGVNVYPQGKKFYGNYALRFNMCLVEGDFTGSGAPAAENAIFGINHLGTNCNWIGADVGPAGGASGTTNQDGVWVDVGAAEAQSQGVPADLAMYTALTFPNGGWYENTSATEQVFANVFRHPGPFTGNAAGTTNIGSPANMTDYPPFKSWVDVEVKQYQGTNYFYMDKTLILSSNSVIFTNGTIMLGYDDPYGNVGDTGAAVYYSDLRVVEIAPFISNQPVSLVVNQGQTATFTAGAVGTAPFTNLWYFGSTLLSSNVVSAATDSNSLVIPGAATANAGSYSLVVSDVAGAITSSVVSLGVIVPPAITNGPVNITTNWHVNVAFSVGVSGSAPVYQWSTNGVALTNGSKFSGATAATLTIANIQLSDAGRYSIVVTNAAGTASNSATLTVIIPPSPSFTGFGLVGTNSSFTFTSTDIYDTTNSFILQSATNVTGPWTNIATTVSSNAGEFQVVVPKKGPTEFYRLEHK